jgi:hypothetical protein
MMRREGGRRGEVTGFLEARSVNCLRKRKGEDGRGGGLASSFKVELKDRERQKERERERERETHLVNCG